jgi:hypothetical protein
MDVTLYSLARGKALHVLRALVRLNNYNSAITFGRDCLGLASN